MNKEAADKPDRYIIQSIDKALTLIELLAERGSLSLIELTELLEQPKSSTYRIILTLQNRGFIARDDEDGKYCLGYKQLMLTRDLLERNTLRAAAMAEMKRLSEQYGDTVNLGVLIDGEVLYVDIIESLHPLRMTDTIGSRAPFHATAMGKAICAGMSDDEAELLARQYGLAACTDNTITSWPLLREELESVRQHGYALDDQEIVEGARCVAAPIYNMYGKVEGAVSLSGAMHRFADDKLPAITEQVKQAAAAVSRKLGYR
ncbi:IclR family transcriptional regulator [Paenibacillus chungangensis]|uniref:IclR family transcriptional regulator n=1 Tax=Paenibacillus chungangensis TaxID=696535 RepID=A0ABW3HP22_9BACL